MLRRAGADQPVVIEVGSAERSHEEIIGERVLFGPLHQAQLAIAEIAHYPSADIRHRSEHVVASAVDLLLVVIKGVDGVWQDHVGPAIDGRRVNPERCVGHFGEARIRLAVGTEDHEIGQRLAVVVELRLLLLRRIGDPVGAGKKSVEMIEAAVLRIDDDDRLDFGQCLVALRLAEPANRRSGGKRQSPFPVWHCTSPCLPKS